MANWQHSIELNGVVSEMNDRYDLSRVEEDCPDAVKVALANEIRKARPIAGYANDIIACVSIAELNRMLDRVYDSADKNLVWCGMFGARKEAV